MFVINYINTPTYTTCPTTTAGLSFILHYIPYFQGWWCVASTQSSNLTFSISIIITRSHETENETNFLYQIPNNIAPSRRFSSLSLVVTVFISKLSIWNKCNRKDKKSKRGETGWEPILWSGTCIHGVLFTINHQQKDCSTKGPMPITSLHMICISPILFSFSNHWRSPTQ